MKMPPLFVAGRPLRIGERLGKGGEGEVYALDDHPGQAIKFYTLADLASREAKIIAMVQAQLAQQSKLVSFPSAVVTDRQGRFAGFMMKLVDGHHPIHHLYSILDRKSYFPAANYPFLVRAAANVARAIADVHSRHCVVGDINHSGLLVSDKAVVALIDADSFQISAGNQRHLCVVGVPEYTPPELQRVQLSTIERTANHDAFGLAVMIFQLLCLGRHPFIGRYQQGEMPLERAITEYRFAYSLSRNVGMSPPPGAVTLSDLPEYIRSGFEAAFRPGGVRPTASQWVDILGRFEASLNRCSANGLHHHAANAGECPWCRMEKTIGLSPFLPLPVANIGSLQTVANGASFDLVSIWRVIDAVQLPPSQIPPPNVPNFEISPSNLALEAAAKTARRTALGTSCIISGGILAVSGQVHIFFILCTIAYGLHQVFTRGQAAERCRSTKVREERQWQQTVEQWETRCGSQEAASLKTKLSQAKKDLEGLPALLRDRLAKYQGQRQQHQRKAHLERFKISSATIKGVGPSLKAALRAWGIESANDISYHQVIQVTGIGDAKAIELMAWKSMAEGRFRFDPNPNATDVKEKDRIAKEIATKEAALKGQLHKGPADLRAMTQRTLTMWKAVDPQVAKSFASLTQAQQDDALVNGPLAERFGKFSFGHWALLIALPLICWLISQGNQIPVTPGPTVPKPSAALVEPAMPVASPLAVDKPDPCLDKAWLDGQLCRNPKLAHQAKETDDAFRAAQAEVEDATRFSLVESHQVWLGQLKLCRETEEPAACLTEAYTARLAEIGTIRWSLESASQSAPALQEAADPNAVAVEARLIRPANSLISSDDYPIAAARSGVQGKVSVELLIDVSGRVSGCNLLQSSGSRDLDGATCILLTRRARYYPARNSAGNPVESRITSSITWNLPE